jgi:hypothetical protein
MTMNSIAAVAALLTVQIASAATVRFAVIGDYGQSSNTVAVAAGILAANPDLICTTGDNTYNTSVSTANWDGAVGQYFAPFILLPANSAYAAQGSATNRFFPVLGNHDWDVGGSAASFTGYFTLPGNERYYSFTQGDVEFFMLSSDPRETDGVTVGSTQYNWFAARIAQSTARWQVVFFHHPFQTSNSSHGPATYMNWGFETLGADLVMSGHNHFMERLSYGGIPWIVQGAGGRSHYSISSPAANSQFRNTVDYGFSIVTATETTLTHQFIKADGTVLDTITLPGSGGGGGGGGGGGEPPFEIYEEVAFQQGVNGYAGTQDKEVRSSGGDTTNGNNVSISVDGDDGSPGLQPNHALIAFDGIVGKAPGQIAAGSEIEQALLIINVIDPGSGMRAYAMTSSWTESTTWAGLGGNGVTPGVECESTPFYSIGADNASSNVATGALSIDVTAQVRAWIDGTQPNFGIALIPFTNGTNGIDFTTSESSVAPRLVVRTLKKGLVQSNFRQGVDGYTGAADTQIAQATPTTSFATASSLSVDLDDPNGTGNKKHVLLSFSQLSVAAGDVVRASLFVQGIDAGDGANLHRTLVPWTDAVTWADSFGGDGVQTDGVEAAVDADANIAVGTTGEIEIDVTEAVREELLAGASSINWVFLSLGNNGWDFVSSEGATAFRPRLSITVEEATCILGDINCDGAVDGIDLAELLGSWGGKGAGDIDQDGVTDGIDLGILLSAWGV